MALKIELLKDPEWRALPDSAKIIYIYMRSKFSQLTVQNGNITLAYSELEDMYSTRTISNGFKMLEKKQFIEKTKQGGLFGGICQYRFVGKHRSFIYKGFEI